MYLALGEHEIVSQLKNNLFAKRILTRQVYYVTNYSCEIEVSNSALSILELSSPDERTNDVVNMCWWYIEVLFEGIDIKYTITGKKFKTAPADRIQENSTA